MRKQHVLREAKFRNMVECLRNANDNRNFILWEIWNLDTFLFLIDLRFGMEPGFETHLRVDLERGTIGFEEVGLSFEMFTNRN